MKRKGILLLSAALLVLFGWSQRHRFAAKSSPGVDLVNETNAESAVPGTGPALPPTLATVTTKSQDQVVDRSQSPQVSLRQMSDLVAYAMKPGARMEEVVKYLRRSGQEPAITKSSNPATGDMFIIRNKNPLPGTRYFHAQYFRDEHGEVFPQHISFQFKPGPKSFQEAVESAQKAFQLGSPKQKKSDFAEWDLDSGTVLWIKKKSAAELSDDPFNAYDPVKDVGTVEVAVELKIHGDAGEGEEDHAH